MTKKTRGGYRDSDTGRFLTQRQAERKPKSTWQKERIPLPGCGDTK